MANRRQLNRTRLPDLPARTMGLGDRHGGKIALGDEGAASSEWSG